MVVQVELRTYLGAAYVFPDMEHAEVERMIDSLQSASLSQITLVNVSQAALCVPLRIVVQIVVDGEERWRSPACTASNP